MENENWQEIAAQHARNEEYYRGLLDQVAAHLGPAVYISDDGSTQDSPLRSKIPELVGKMTSDTYRLVGILALAQKLDKALYHQHRSRDGKPYGPGGCYSSMYEPCGEHHAHDMTCGSYPRYCRRSESEPEVNALHDALVALEKSDLVPPVRQ